MEKYWQILKQYKGGLAVSPLLVLITVLCETVQPMFMAEIIDNGVMPRDLSVITRVGTFMILISLAGLFVNIINVYVSLVHFLLYFQEIRKPFAKYQVNASAQNGDGGYQYNSQLPVNPDNEKDSHRQHKGRTEQKPHRHQHNLLYTGNIACQPCHQLFSQLCSIFAEQHGEILANTQTI